MRHFIVRAGLVILFILTINSIMYVAYAAPQVALSLVLVTIGIIWAALIIVD